MSNWIKSSWFGELVSTIRDAVGEAQGLLDDDTACRAQTDAILRATGICKEPEMLTAKTLATELAKVITRTRLQGEDPGVFDSVYPYLPPLRKIQEALQSPELHKHVRIPPTPPVIQDPRIDPKEFWRVLNEQAFFIPVDD